MRAGRADPRVAAWSVAQPSEGLFLSVVTIRELETGILLLERHDRAAGRVLRTWLEDHLLVAFAGRTLPVDTPVARRCARLHVPRSRPERDALIAATALVHGLTVVTRNVADFAPMGVDLFNPWTD